VAVRGGCAQATCCATIHVHRCTVAVPIHSWPRGPAMRRVSPRGFDDRGSGGARRWSCLVQLGAAIDRSDIAVLFAGDMGHVPRIRTVIDAVTAALTDCDALAARRGAP
jgi:hypothetical protein